MQLQPPEARMLLLSLTELSGDYSCLSLGNLKQLTAPTGVNESTNDGSREPAEARL